MCLLMISVGDKFLDVLNVVIICFIDVCKFGYCKMFVFVVGIDFFLFYF